MNRMMSPFQGFQDVLRITQGAARPSPAAGYGGQAMGWYNTAPLALPTI